MSQKPDAPFMHILIMLYRETLLHFFQVTPPSPSKTGSNHSNGHSNYYSLLEILEFAQGVFLLLDKTNKCLHTSFTVSDSLKWCYLCRSRGLRAHWNWCCCMSHLFRCGWLRWTSTLPSSSFNSSSITFTTAVQ